MQEPQRWVLREQDHGRAGAHAQERVENVAFPHLWILVASAEEGLLRSRACVYTT